MSFAADYPIAPAPDLTPGQLCTRPITYRYPEKIAYCDRDVSTGLKKQIIEDYDRAFSYRIDRMPRDHFKIDHFIPLCVGGSNDISNLWPQHVSLFTVTDALEESVCEKMKEGKLLQKDAIQIIMKAKLNINEAPRILRFVRNL